MVISWFLLWGRVRLVWNTCMWGEDLSLKTLVVTHPGASDASQCLTSNTLVTVANLRATPGPMQYYYLYST